MRTLPPLPDWCSLEHQVAEILTEQEIHGWYFDEPKAFKLESSSQKRDGSKLKQYFEDNSLSLQDRCSLLNEITQPQGYREGCRNTTNKGV